MICTLQFTLSTLHLCIPTEPNRTTMTFHRMQHHSFCWQKTILVPKQQSIEIRPAIETFLTMKLILVTGHSCLLHLCRLSLTLYNHKSNADKRHFGIVWLLEKWQLAASDRWDTGTGTGTGTAGTETLLQPPSYELQQRVLWLITAQTNKVEILRQ